jgi:hypothetical protein
VGSIARIKVRRRHGFLFSVAGFRFWTTGLTFEAKKPTLAAITNQLIARNL